MKMLIGGLILFLGAHSLSIVASGWRDRVATRVGERPFQAVYALISIVGLALVIWGYGLARLHPTPIYVPPLWLRHLTHLLMVPVFPLLIAAYLPGRIRAAAKHPMLAAVTLWAFAHLLANGMLADIVLFGSFFLWSIMDRVSMGWRAPRPVPGTPPSKWNDLVAVGMGLVLYAVFVLWLHRWLIGVPVVG